MIKHINGSWFEFWHHCLPEGKYVNPVVRYFSDEQWREKIREMAGLQMKYLVLTCSSMVYDDYAESYFKTDIFPFAKDMVCQDPMGVMLDEADAHGMKIFISAGFYGNWQHTVENMTSPEVTERAFKAMGELYNRYGHHPSFYGFYFPDETCILPYYADLFIDYVNKYSAFGRSLNKDLKMLIAPYGTCLLKADDHFVSQLEVMDVDFIAYQDEVGVRKATPESAEGTYAALRKAHDKAGRAALWADMELFQFEDEVYKSALIPTDIARIRRQLECISPYVDEILCYEYLGVMNKPGTIAYCGHPDSIRFYNEYAALVDEITKK